MQRRNFIKLCCILSATAALPFKLPKSWATTQPSLFVPGLLKPDSAGRIKIKIAEGSSFWRKTATRTWGYNGSLLGPAISVRRGQIVIMIVENALPELTTVHWHGLEIPAISDGGPQQIINPGAVWQPELSIDQPAATCWFHPHPHRNTGRHTAMGLAGLFLIEDDESEKLALPKNWGVDDIPVILQDKRLNKNGQIDYVLDIVSANIGWLGDFLLTNGAIYPKHTVPRGWIRLRLLNACNARPLQVACSDNRPMYVIAGDGGFLPEPVKLNELNIYMGERFEVLVNTQNGKPFDLICSPIPQMGMMMQSFNGPVPALRIIPTQRVGHQRLPDKLVSLPPLPRLTGLLVRKLQLSMDSRMGGMGHGGMEHGGMMRGGRGSMMESWEDEPFDLWSANRINGKAFTMNTSSFDVKRGQYERWIISGVDDRDMLHPFHIHSTQFRILKENGEAPAVHRRGLKDTVFVRGGESEVLARFMHPASVKKMFMAHCHVLEHEDTGMMLSFTVTG